MLNNEVMESDVINSEASTSVLFHDRMVSIFLLTVYVRDVASPILSWHSLR